MISDRLFFENLCLLFYDLFYICVETNFLDLKNFVVEDFCAE